MGSCYMTLDYRIRNKTVTFEGNHKIVEVVQQAKTKSSKF